MPFRALGLGPRILKAIRDAGYTEPTPVQAQAVPLVLAGRDVIGIAQTGTGKTAAYLWPLLERLSTPDDAAARPGRRRTRVLILVPTRELAEQVQASVRGYA